MRLLILGANGQLGSDLVRIGGKDFSGLEFLSYTRKQVDLVERRKAFELLQQENFDILINCTSYHKTDEAEAKANDAFLVNAHSVQKMAEICHLKGARFVHISTDYVFNGFSKEPYLESDIPGPLNVYGASKLMGESLAFSMHSDTLVLRVASLFGISGSSGKGGNFVETMIRLGKEKGELKVVKDILMSPTSTAELSRMILRLITQKAPAGIYHAVNSGNASWYDFADEIIRQTRVKAEVIPIFSKEYPTPALRPAYSVLSNSKLQQMIGPIPHWKDSLKEYLHEKGYVSL